MKSFMIAAMCVVLVGCATKRYPMATELSAVERAELTCRELNIELAKVAETRAQIADTAEIDWRSGAAFIADFGIGNAMAKSEADAALANRETSIQSALAAKNCSQQ
ncbi:MAG: hypothetical protein AAFY12_11950 [Pseudomonadota bacterium]